ncbi:MAG: CheB methylesterase domain-containing protein [Burkholderiaceae bacterium]
MRALPTPASPATRARSGRQCGRTRGRQADRPDKPAGSARNLSRRIGPEQVIAIGASTGGTEAIRHLLAALPPPARRSDRATHASRLHPQFASRLNGLSALDVREAVSGETLQRGRAYLAPGGRHMRVVARAAQRVLRLDDQTEVNGHRPSVDVLFDSVADVIGSKAVGVILTGMGKDGAKGLLHMREKGACTLGQDQASCVVYGMPREAVTVGGVELVLPLGDIGPTLAQAITGQ